MARSGYTLPVFAVVAAKAALLHLLGQRSAESVTIDLLSEDGLAVVDVEQVAALDPCSALAICRSDPGDNLDLTRHTPIWAWVQLQERLVSEPAWQVEGGEGIGRTAAGDPAIYGYAKRLFAANLEPMVPIGQRAVVRILLPEGRRLAERTSNAAFGVLGGLALLGTSGIARPEAATDFLAEAQQRLQQVLAEDPDPVFCIGSHSLQVAERLGFGTERLVRTANWLGALLVEAGLRQAASVRLLGYHGKLLKLAGGIFHTSSHVADGRLEVLAAAAIRTGAELGAVQRILGHATVDAAAQELAAAGLEARVFAELAERIRQRSRAYVHKYAERWLPIGVVLFDRQGRILVEEDPC